MAVVYSLITLFFTLHYVHRKPLKDAVSAALHDVGFVTKTAVEESRENKDDKNVGPPEDERQLMTPIIRHHPEPPTELPHPFAESVEVWTEPAVTAEPELLLLPDSPPASKVCICTVLHRNLCAVQQ